jgi:D-alanyl-lipoteichoic acid acyltransferase DltB (MBOAT superfamily)
VAVWFVCRNILGHTPIGISYYCFKIISYLVDRYTGKTKSKASLADYAIYISFFPQIVSGPISRSDEIIRQLDNMTLTNRRNWINGIRLIVMGGFLKYVIAERLVFYVDAVFGNYNSYNGMALLMAAFFYSVEIYCDFAGYSSISIGVARIFGIQCSDNFDRPYLAANIKEFWARWHISLSSWLRDYIYIPLGGNRKGKLRRNVNIIITFLVSGIWHGNGTGYIFWGLYHGMLNIIFTKKSNNHFVKLLMIVINFVAVTFGWIFFKLEDVVEGFKYVKHMLLDFRINIAGITEAVLPFTNDNSCVAFMLTACVFIFIELVLEIARKDSEYYSTAVYMFYAVSIVLFGAFGSSGFIYMNY